MTASIKPARHRGSDPFELKSAAVNLLAFTPLSADLDAMDGALQRKLAGRPDFFADDAVVIELDNWPDSATALELSGLLAILRRAGMQPVAVRGGTLSAREAALHTGLASLPDVVAAAREPAADSMLAPGTAATRAVTAIVPPSAASVIVDKPVRSGQQVYARGSDLIVLALTSHGAELIADGNIHVYAPLRGRALAGARGNHDARIFTYCMEAELLSVAGVYRTIDEPLPDSIRGKAAQVRLDGTKLVIESLKLD